MRRFVLDPAAKVDLHSRVIAQRDDAVAELDCLVGPGLDWLVGENLRDVAGETGHRNPAPQVADQRGQHLGDVLLAARVALDHRIGRVADHRQHRRW